MGACMKGRDILKNMVSSSASDSTKSPVQTQAPHKPAGAVRAMNLSLGRLGDEAAAAKELRTALAAGDKVVELSPAQIEASFIRDRIPTDHDPALQELISSMRESGQQVPILVRPHPTKENHYQAAYGHRRLRAAVILDRPIKAIVRQLSDDELIVAQGQENGPPISASSSVLSLRNISSCMVLTGTESPKFCQWTNLKFPVFCKLLTLSQNK
jgi:ParB family transcriptional regulator, chromosome partitioning protein